ncbi:HDIG domain-containing metalloprotein [Zongyangia hominis]|uniref:HDIG domain-containing protein n=1 Tax=Zongyangia hominis TaxID=2763677 RepID=A0A926IC54_9FIRM|nr:HDIG domain-containing metalloprotein [Zongyangia hominis]MBC8570750.1 HDIG domain-containing protein [Zongyangia hominis]
MTSTEIFRQIERHLMEDVQPSQALEELFDRPLPPEFAPLWRLKTTEQSPVHHPEGNVWNHTMLVIDQAAKRRGESKYPEALMWAALLHDIGKPDTTRVRRGKITSYNHEKVGASLARRFLSGFLTDKMLIERVCMLIRYHMQILFVVRDLPFADVKGMKKRTDVEEVALLGLCDLMGRLHSNLATEEGKVQRFIEKCGR